MENRKTAEKKANWKISGALAALLAAVAVFTVMLPDAKQLSKTEDAVAFVSTFIKPTSAPA